MAKAEKKLTRIQSLVWAEEAAKGNSHEERMAWIDKNVPVNFRALVRDHMVGFLSVKIYNLPTKELRRAAIDDIPLDCDPPWARSLVESQILSMWRERKMAG